MQWVRRSQIMSIETRCGENEGRNYEFTSVSGVIRRPHLTRPYDGNGTAPAICQLLRMHQCLERCLARRQTMPSAGEQKIRCLMPFILLLGFVFVVLHVFVLIAIPVLGRLHLDAVVEITGDTAQYPMHHTHHEQNFFLRSREISAQNVYDGHQTANNSDSKPPQHPSTDLKVDRHTILLT